MAVRSLFVSILFASLGCAPTASAPDRAPAARIEGQEWVLVAFDDAEPAPHEPEITALVSEERIQGTSACNEYFADLKPVEAGRIEVGPVGTTRMLCPDEVMEIERRYLDLLRAVRAHRIRDGRLLLEWQTGDGKQGALIFDRRKP